jgi:hypothetical protein
MCNKTTAGHTDREDYSVLRTNPDNTPLRKCYGRGALSRSTFHKTENLEDGVEKSS